MAEYRRGRVIAKPLVGLLIAMALTGCVHPIDRAIEHHQKTAGAVEIGMNEDAFVDLMSSAIRPTSDGGNPFRFSRNDSMYVVYFARVAHGSDDLVTDDEYTPYTFKEGRLIAVGWQYYRGEQHVSQAERPEEASVNEATLHKPQPTASPLSHGAFKWCAPDVTGYGQCSGAPCC